MATFRREERSMNPVVRYLRVLPWFGALMCACLNASAEAILYGVTTTGSLVRFNATAPGTILATTAITGLQAGESIAAIDFRPANGGLYGLGSTSRLYVINTTTGTATQVGASGTFTLTGTAFGMDFNPVVDRIRVTSDADQNLRLDPNTGALTGLDTPLNYSGGGPDPNVVATAYTNNLPGTTTTTLYDVDSNLDVLVLQNPPNGGALVSVGLLGVNIDATSGFDIRTAKGVNTAYGSFAVGGVSRLFTVNLNTGAATLVGTIGGNPLAALAVAPARGLPGDFAATGRSGIAWRDAGSGALALWLMNGSAVTGTGFFNLPADWVLAGTGDFDGDGSADILWRRASGESAIWFMRGLVRTSSAFFTVPPEWDVAAVGDINADGRADIVWRRPANGDLALWFMNGASASGTTFFNVPTNWTLEAAADFNGDGTADLLWHDHASGAVALWFMNGPVRSSTAFLSAPTEWSIQGSGDIDGDGKADIAWRRATGDLALWFMNGGTLSSASFYSTVPPEWVLQGIGDFDGNDKSDLLWRNAATSDLAVWFMNGASLAATAFYGVPANWTVVAP
jgi:uncharacterized protein DUF4394/VCBS repeat protein